MGLDTSYDNISEVLSLLQRYKQKIIVHNGDNYTNKFYNMIYLDVNNKVNIKNLPFTPSPLRLKIFRLFVILSLTQLYRYTPEIFLFSTATFKYTYRDPLRRIGQDYSAKVAW